MFDPNAWLGALMLGGIITLIIFFTFMGITFVKWLMNKEEKDYYERSKK